MKTISVWHRTALALFLAVGAMTQPALSADAPGKHPLADAVQPFVDKHELAGAVMLVADKDKILTVEEAGYADIAAKSLMGANTVFWIASQSKPITAAALMILFDEGKFKLDDPVAKYLPEFKDVMVKGPDNKLMKPSHPITIREIMSHTSGLPFSSPQENPTLDGLTLRDAILSYTKNPLNTEPGTKYSYSNAGINTGGRLIEVLSGMPYEDFLEKRLLAPLDMKDTTFWPNEEQVKRLAKSYHPTNDKMDLEEIKIGQLTYPLSDRKRQPMPAGGLFSTATDVAHFCQLVLGGGVYNGRRILSEEAVKLMTSKQTPPPLNDGYGLGWATWGSGYGHGGAHSTNMMIDSNRGIILVWMVQHAGFPGNGGQSQDAFRQASDATFQGGAQSFFLKKGDIVVVMGDSITEQRLYSNYLEIWSQTRFPSDNLVFRNVGIGGDRSTGGTSRFKRDVLPFKPTVLTVDFGMNDGSYTAFKEQNFRPYMNGLQGIADQAKAAGIRVAWITPQPTERGEPGTQSAGYNETLKKFSGGVGEIAKHNNGLFVDQFTPYLAVLNKARETDPKIRITGGDAVHPGPPGQALMAASILKGMGFPREVSSVSIDASSGEAKGKFSKVTHVDTKGGVKFQRLDQALPYFPEQAKSILKWTPLLEEMNHYGLQIKNLAPGQYEVRLDGKKAAEYNAKELAAGVNLAAAALNTGPVADQIKSVSKAVDAKTNYYHDRIFRGLVLADIARQPEFKDVAPADREKRRQALIEERLTKMAELDAAIHAALQIRPYMVEVVPVK